MTRWLPVCRKRRLYAAQDIQQLVEQLGLQCGAGCCSNLSFGLELFDDSSYDTRNPQEWMPAAAGEWGSLPAQQQVLT
jgi:dynein heavy chain